MFPVFILLGEILKFIFSRIFWYQQTSICDIIIEQYALKKCSNCLNTKHRHLSNIDCLTMRTACIVCFISTDNGHSKKKSKKSKNVVLVAGT
jgi:hypothetical protein